MNDMDIMGDWVPEYHEYPILKLDYFNRVRVFVTQLIPDMIADDAVPADFQLEYVIRTYRKFEKVGKTKSFQAADTMAIYRRTYVENLHLLIEKYLEEVTEDDREKQTA